MFAQCHTAKQSHVDDLRLLRWVDLAGSYSKQAHLLEHLVKALQRAERGAREVSEAPPPGRKQRLTAVERSEIVAKYEAGASLATLKAEHCVAKNTVAKVLRDAGVMIRPRGRRPM